MGLDFGLINSIFKESPEDGQVNVYGSEDETWQDFLNKLNTIAADTVVNSAAIAADGVVNANIALTTGTYYWTAAGCTWMPEFFGKDDGDNGQIGDNVCIVGEDSTTFFCPVVGIPNGAVITAVTVWGDASGETWTLKRSALAGARVTMATAAFDSADTSISYATIDNNNYVYTLVSSTLDIGDEINGTRITYTI